jgi:hypothetical protein
MKKHKITSRGLVALALVAASLSAHAFTTRVSVNEPAHLSAAKELVAEIVAEGNEGIFTGPDGKAINRYGGSSATNYVTWSPLATCYGRCSSFLTMILESTYVGWEPENSGFASTSPTAAMYHDAIAANACGFTNIVDFNNIQPGDLLVAKYLDGSPDTGHVMMVESEAKSAPDSKGVVTWLVQVIDCADSAHTNDTRVFVTPSGTKHTTGAGAGTIQVFKKGGAIQGYSWSATKSSMIHTQSQRNVVLGRFNLGG